MNLRVRGLISLNSFQVKVRPEKVVPDVFHADLNQKTEERIC